MPPAPLVPFPTRSVAHPQDLTVPELLLFRSPLQERPSAFARATYPFLKRAIDLTLSLLLLLPIIPVLAVCALAIRLDSPGPVFFTQPRTGKGGKRFRMYKLRTMYKNAEELKEKYRHLNTQTWPDFKIPNDPRITRVGGFLRKTSLDELPQIVNVIIGDMSLVGPRPTSFAASTYDLWHTVRLEAKPGITGLWQVSGRCNIDFDDRIRLDVAYIRNQSLWLDSKILAQTVLCVVSRKGAE
ncbi:MAG: sugar transferase [Pseudomonadota bacterium]|nr:sugar transferase [Pseudomonadota bacterium]